MSTTVRVTEETRRRVAALAQASGRQMQQVLDDAVTAYERELFWRQFANGYEELATDPVGWAELQAERQAETPAVRDGLTTDEPPRPA
ncbi:MAG: hypothetical protein ACYCO3_02660 [Mycobacteriales bacterium]